MRFVSRIRDEVWSLLCHDIYFFSSFFLFALPRVDKNSKYNEYYKYLIGSCCSLQLVYLHLFETIKFVVKIDVNGWWLSGMGVGGGRVIGKKKTKKHRFFFSITEDDWEFLCSFIWSLSIYIGRWRSDFSSNDTLSKHTFSLACDFNYVCLHRSSGPISIKLRLNLVVPNDI